VQPSTPHIVPHCTALPHDKSNSMTPWWQSHWQSILKPSCGNYKETSLHRYVDRLVSVDWREEIESHLTEAWLSAALITVSWFHRQITCQHSQCRHQYMWPHHLHAHPAVSTYTTLPPARTMLLSLETTQRWLSLHVQKSTCKFSKS